LSRENVVPFQRSSRIGMARRGAPDKRQPVSSETLEVECPNCAAVLCLDPALLGQQPEVCCAECDLLIPLRVCGAGSLPK
jgi:hypothetical protein